MRPHRLAELSLGIVLLLASCTRFGAVYPPRPPSVPAVPVADPTPSRIVAHVSVTARALAGAMDDVVPKSGDGAVSVLGSQRAYTWERLPFVVSFWQQRIVLDTHVVVKLDV